MTGRPQKASVGLQDSISSVLRTLSVEDEAPRTRPRIITKYDFMQTRDKKSHLDLPPEFLISTDLQVSHGGRNAQVNTVRVSPLKHFSSTRHKRYETDNVS